MHAYAVATDAFDPTADDLTAVDATVAVYATFAVVATVAVVATTAAGKSSSIFNPHMCVPKGQHIGQAASWSPVFM